MDKYCRLCLSMTEGHYIEINTSKYRKQLEIVIPELNIGIIQAPLLCEKCSETLETAFKFKNNCLEVDNYLRIYVEANDTDLVPLSQILTIKNNLGNQSDNFTESIRSSIKSEDELSPMKTDDEDSYDEKHSVYLTDNLDNQNQENHQKNPESRNKLKCDRCDKEFSNARQLKRHQTYHPKRKYKCDVSGCNELFLTRTDLVQHKKQHSELTCGTCGHILRTYRSYQNHLRKHLGLFKCDICGMSFPNTAQLKSHEVVHTGAREFVCDLCGKGFGQASTLRMHIGCVHATERPYSCDVCGRSFTQLKLKKLHMNAMHLEKDRKFTCTICGKSLRFKSSLSDHMKRHSGERKHVCKICDKRFIDSSGLKKHVVIHGNDKPHECQYCFKRTNQKYNLTIHLRTCVKKKQAERMNVDSATVVGDVKNELMDNRQS